MAPLPPISASLGASLRMHADDIVSTLLIEEIVACKIPLGALSLEIDL